MSRLAAKLQATAVPLADRAATPSADLAAQTGGGAEAAAPAAEAPRAEDAERTE